MSILNGTVSVMNFSAIHTAGIVKRVQPFTAACEPGWPSGKCPQNVTCVCKSILSVKHTLLECPVTTVISEKWI